MMSLPRSLRQKASSARPSEVGNSRGPAVAAGCMGLVLMLAMTGGYLAGPARQRMDGLTAGVVLLHLAVGVTAAPFCLWVLVGPGRSLLDRGLRRPAGCALSLAILTGVALTVRAAAGRAAGAGVLAAHLVSAPPAAVLVVFALLSRQQRAAREHVREQSYSPPRAPAGWSPLVALTAVGLGLLAAAGAAAVTSYKGGQARYEPEEYFRNLTATNARQAANAMFPAGTRWRSQSTESVPSAAYCGAAGCHPRAYRQWLESSHHRAAASLAYLRLTHQFAAQRGADAPRWCDGCHAPHFGKLSSGREGVTCVACHAVARLPDLSGNGRVELGLPAGYPFAEASDARLHWLHGFLLRLRPGPHRRASMSQALHGQSQFCAGCHRTSYNLPQNRYKFLRTADDYGAWQSGPYSGESVHGLVPPGPARRCQDCHDPHRGGVRCSVFGVRDDLKTEHRTPNTEHLNTPISLDLLALRRPSRVPGGPEELVAPLERAAPLLQPGETVTVDLVVRNRAVGHQFPAGTADRKQAWLQVELRDASGRVLARSGRRQRWGGPEPGTHIYGLAALDARGLLLTGGDLWNMVTPLYHRSLLPGRADTDRRILPPGGSDVARYRLRVPRSAPGPLQLRAQLWYGAIYTGPGAPTPLPRLMAQDRVSLPVAANAAVRKQGTVKGPLPDRFFDYGVGLLLQGDLPRAQRAMRRVLAWAPRDGRGHLGLGQVYLAEGDLLAAREQFEQASRMAPGDPRCRAFLATTERRMGLYDRALALLEPLVRAYPRDAQLWFDAGMCHYLAGRYEPAAAAFAAMLAIDPDDLAGHYNLMRCLRRLQRIPEARREEVIYQILAEDDDAKPIALAYLRRNPAADQETRTIHEHLLRSTPESRP
jgi:tetratricopeptide (TPR) repeat protein